MLATTAIDESPTRTDTLLELRRFFMDFLSFRRAVVTLNLEDVRRLTDCGQRVAGNN
jgi:hypothetical protein